ncbi:MAG TPA: hypothetical protein EYQ81_05005 [Sneathiellales bacterium]|nr:hypothetical protein [Sneathiellales bacterium]
MGILLCGLVWPQISEANDFPTEARAEYVIACMSGTGENARSLRHCACAVDRIAAELKYDQYVAAETVLRMRKMNGEKGSLFRESDSLTKTVKALDSAVTEAKKGCF